MTVALAAMIAVLPAAGWAFDTGGHFDLTSDAMTTEGFGKTAVQVAQVANTMVDYYSNAGSNPYSGKADSLKTFLTTVMALTWINQENWSDTLCGSAERLHFDSTSLADAADQTYKLDGTAHMTMAWDRLARATRGAALSRAGANDAMGLLVVLGISLHCLQDFYVHTNWVEPSGKAGYDGPGWAQRGNLGSNPTWYDLAPSVRDQGNVYSGGATDLSSVGPNDPRRRNHGDWNSDGNQSLATSLNKDWPGRPLYREGYITAYFATRQWIRAVAAWINNPAVWNAACAYNNRFGNQLDRDVNGMGSIGFYTGHWQGQGEPAGAGAPGPGGSLDELPGVITDYHKPGKTVFRTKFEQMLVEVASTNPPPGDTPVESSRDLQADLDFVALKVSHVRDATPTLAVGIDPGVDEADFYAKANIAGQEFMSAMIHGFDDYTFPLPNYPFMFIKTIPKTWQIDEPVTTLRVEVHTADATYAGTNDDVFLRINDQIRFPLDKPLYDDFERDDTDLYCIAPPAGLRVRDIDYIQMEKSPDGTAGGWKLGGIRVFVNGALFYQNNGINTWIEKNNLTWRAPDFQKKTPKTDEIPVVLALWDSDGGLYGDDDPCDINPNYGLFDLRLLYRRANGQLRGDAAGANGGVSLGGSDNGGRGSDSDRCEIAFSFESYTVTPPPPLPLIVTVTGVLKLPLVAKVAKAGAGPAVVAPKIPNVGGVTAKPAATGEPQQAPASTATLAPPAVSEAFGTATPPGWMLLPGAKIEDGVLACSEMGHGVWIAAFPDEFTLKVRYRLGQGIGQVVFRLTGELPKDNDYRLRLDGLTAVLARAELGQEQVLQMKLLALQPGTWHDLVISFSGGRVRLAVDGKPVLDVTDAKPLPNGVLAFGSVNGKAFAFDDITVSSAP
jgi:hypothetical protein